MPDLTAEESYKIARAIEDTLGRAWSQGPSPTYAELQEARQALDACIRENDRLPARANSDHPWRETWSQALSSRLRHASDLLNQIDPTQDTPESRKKKWVKYRLECQSARYAAQNVAEENDPNRAVKRAVKFALFAACVGNGGMYGAQGTLGVLNIKAGAVGGVLGGLIGVAIYLAAKFILTAIYEKMRTKTDLSANLPAWTQASNQQHQAEQELQELRAPDEQLPMLLDHEVPPEQEEDEPSEDTPRFGPGSHFE